MKALTTIYDVSDASQTVERGHVQFLTCSCQLVKAQGDRDENIKALAASMRDMLASLSEIQELAKIKLLQSTIDLAMTRIDDCAEFIRVYARHGFWGELVRLPFAYVAYWNRNRPTDSPVANQTHCGYDSEIPRRFCSIEGEVQHRGRCSDPQSYCRNCRSFEG